jgi:hypothetical protein
MQPQTPTGRDRGALGFARGRGPDSGVAGAQRYIQPRSGQREFHRSRARRESRSCAPVRDGAKKLVLGPLVVDPWAGPASGGLHKQVCTSSSDDDPPVVYEVTVLDDDPSTVLWVRADALEATDEAVAEFFSYVARHSLEDTDPLNADTWIGENVSSGGGYSAEGVELKLYGTESVRTLEIVATGLASDMVTEPSDRSGTKDRDRTLR